MNTRDTRWMMMKPVAPESVQTVQKSMLAQLEEASGLTAEDFVAQLAEVFDYPVYSMVDLLEIFTDEGIGTMVQ